VIIIEDDPYWYLQFPSALESQSRGTPLASTSQPHVFEHSSGYPFLDSLVPSYLNVDPDGRVVRLDTFSKTVAPGCRLGWITAQPAIIERILRIAETSTQQPSGFVQSMIAELLIGPQASAASTYATLPKAQQKTFSGWQTAGWVRWLEGLRGVYERRMGRMCALLDEGAFLLKQATPIKPAEADWAVISKTQMYSFSWPRGGMFVWLKVHFENHPLYGKVSAQELATGLWIWGTQKPYLVLTAPGAMFSPTEEIREGEGYKYFRLCFAAVAEEEVDASSRRFAEGVKAFWGIKRVEDLPRLEEDGAADVREGGEVCDLGMLGAC
jgi:DNA-binding transcriptional MocR family regulator